MQNRKVGPRPDRIDSVFPGVAGASDKANAPAAPGKTARAAKGKNTQEKVMRDIETHRNSGNMDSVIDNIYALENLRIQLLEANRLQVRMHKINAAIKKERNPVRLVRNLMYLFNNDRTLTIQFLKPRYDGKIGYTKQQIVCNRSDIMRIKKYIYTLEKMLFAKDKEEVTDNYLYREDVKENKIMFRFICNVSDSMSDMLKTKGFRWSSERDVWSRQWTDKGIIAARQVMDIMAVKH
jgi:hypothetical protein